MIQYFFHLCKVETNGCCDCFRCHMLRINILLFLCCHKIFKVREPLSKLLYCFQNQWMLTII